jgi:hypothetical protein
MKRRSIVNVQIVEMTVKCRVPQEDAEDYIIRLRRGEEKLPVPAGLVCKDAFDAMETSDPDTTTIRAGYRLEALQQ